MCRSPSSRPSSWPSARTPGSRRRRSRRTRRPGSRSRAAPAAPDVVIRRSGDTLVVRAGGKTAHGLRRRLPRRATTATPRARPAAIGPPSFAYAVAAGAAATYVACVDAAGAHDGAARQRAGRPTGTRLDGRRRRRDRGLGRGRHHPRRASWPPAPSARSRRRSGMGGDLTSLAVAGDRVLWSSRAGDGTTRVRLKVGGAAVAELAAERRRSRGRRRGAGRRRDGGLRAPRHRCAGRARVEIVVDAAGRRGARGRPLVAVQRRREGRAAALASPPARLLAFRLRSGQRGTRGGDLGRRPRRGRRQAARDGRPRAAPGSPIPASRPAAWCGRGATSAPTAEVARTARASCPPASVPADPTGAPLEPAAYLARPSPVVARDLIGCTLLVDGVGGRIVEVEAYGWPGDPRVAHLAGPHGAQLADVRARRGTSTSTARTASTGASTSSASARASAPRCSCARSSRSTGASDGRAPRRPPRARLVPRPGRALRGPRRRRRAQRRVRWPSRRSGSCRARGSCRCWRRPHRHHAGGRAAVALRRGGLAVGQRAARAGSSAGSDGRPERRSVAGPAPGGAWPRCGDRSSSRMTVSGGTISQPAAGRGVDDVVRRGAPPSRRARTPRPAASSVSLGLRSGRRRSTSGTSTPSVYAPVIMMVTIDPAAASSSGRGSLVDRPCRAAAGFVGAVLDHHAEALRPQARDRLLHGDRRRSSCSWHARHDDAFDLLGQRWPSRRRRSRSGSSGPGVCATTVPGSSPAAAGLRTKRMVTPPPLVGQSRAPRLRVMPVKSGTLIRLREHVESSVGALSAASTSSRA